MSSKSQVSVTVEGTVYPSRCAAAKALVSAGKTISEAAKISGMTYQTVYAVTKGADKVSVRKNKYRALRLAQSKREHSVSSIAKKVGIAPTTLRDLLKKKGIVPTATKAAAAIAAKKASDKTAIKAAVIAAN